MDSGWGDPGVTVRSEVLRSLEEQEPWDVLVIGGGSSGFGAAVEAAAR
jgi:glycerol-3-phosphate dehydrogenase